MSWTKIALVNINERFNITFNEGSVVLVHPASPTDGQYIWHAVQLIHLDSKTAMQPFCPRFENVYLLDHPGEYQVISHEVKKCMMKMLNLSEFNPFSIQDPFTLKIQSYIQPNITLNLRREGETNYIEYKSSTMFVDPHESFELEYFYELKTQDDRSIRTKINKRRLGPAKSCINNFKIVEELINMSGHFMMKFDFLTSDMIIDLQILYNGVWINLNRGRIREPGKMIWSLDPRQHRFDTLTRDAVIEWRLSVTCAASKFSAYSDVRRTVLTKRNEPMKINGQKFRDLSFAYTDKKEEYVDDFVYYSYTKPRSTKFYQLHLLDNRFFILTKKSNMSSSESYYITGEFEVHEQKTASDEENQVRLKLFPNEHNSKPLYTMIFKETLQSHHPVFSIVELNEMILRSVRIGCTSVEFFKLSLICRSWYNYVKKYISITGTIHRSHNGGFSGLTFDNWLDLKFKNFYFKPPFFILDKHT